MARILPAGLNANDKTATELSGPVRGLPIWRRVATSHNRTVPSKLPLARVLPSGLNTTELTGPGVPGKDGDRGMCGSGQHGVASLVGGVDAPCRDALQLGDDGDGVTPGFAIS